jgi:hypothetical protein
LLDTWECIFGVCNPSSSVTNESHNNPAYIGGVGSPRVVYSTSSNSLFVGPRWNFANFIRSDVWMYDITADRWYYLIDNSSASYSSIGVPSLSNRPPFANLGELVVIQEQVYLVGVGSEEKWSLTVCDQSHHLSNSSFTCNSCNIGESSPGAASQCSDCSSGKYALGYLCVNCAAGYSSSPGSSNCTVCDLGTFSTSGSQCTSCPIGKFSDSQGLSVCLDCPEGYITSYSGSSNVLNCSVLSACSVGRSLTNGKCLRTHSPSMVWTWISGSSTITTSSFTPTSFGAELGGRVVGSQTQPVGYLFGGIDSSGSASQRIYSLSADFSSVVSLSLCSTTDFGTAGVESSTSCPTPRVAAAIWLIKSNMFTYMVEILKHMLARTCISFIFLGTCSDACFVGMICGDLICPLEIGHMFLEIHNLELLQFTLGHQCIQE